MSTARIPPDPSVTLARIEVKLDQALRTDQDHEERIRALESRNWPRQTLNAWVSALAAVCAVAVVIEGLFVR